MSDVLDNIITVPSALSADQLDLLARAQSDEQSVLATGTAYQRSRAIAYLNRHKFVTSVSSAALAYHVDKVMGYKVDGIKKGDLQLCAMAILQLDVLRAPDKASKADQNNRINDLRRALEALDYFGDEIAALSDDEFVTWYGGKGSLDGIYSEFRAATREEVEPERDDKKIAETIEALILNPGFVEVANVSGTTGVQLFVARGEGEKLRMVPLDASPDFIASLAGRAPDPMANAAPRVVFFRELLMTAARIVPDQMSDVPLRPFRSGEKPSASTQMLPANHIICVESGVFSVAGSRVQDTIVLDVVPHDEVMAHYLDAPGFIDTVTRKNMLAKLEATADAARLRAVSLTNRASQSGPEVRVVFEDGDEKDRGQLIVKSQDRMGGLYTWKVKAFKAEAYASLSADEREVMVRRFLPVVVKSRENHPITVTIGDKGLGLQLGTAKAETISTDDIAGARTARVTKEDFLRAINGLLALPLVEGMTWSIDPRGLLRVEVMTEQATYRAHVQTLRQEKDPKAQVRERALLARVERPETVAIAA